MDENIVLFDWLSFTTKIHSVSDVIDIIGMGSVPWETIKGAHGYKERLYFNGVNIFFNGRDDMGVWCEMSGQGCRAFESIGSGDYEYIFGLVKYGDLHITRLDVAFDDHTGLLDIGRICYLLDVSKKHLIYKSAPKSKEPPVKRILHPQFPSIDHRPQHINTRQELGHWEMDCVCGEQGTLSALLVFTERVTRYELIFKIPNKTTSSVVNVLDGLERRYPDFNERFRSITCDNGSEFMDYPGMVRSVYGGKRTEIYYCHPYCSSERGSNENCNRIIRRWIPKGQDIGQYSEGYIQKVQDWINYYPRRLHGHFSAAACADVWLSA